MNLQYLFIKIMKNIMHVVHDQICVDVRLFISYATLLKICPYYFLYSLKFDNANYLHILNNHIPNGH